MSYDDEGSTRTLLKKNKINHEKWYWKFFTQNYIKIIGTFLLLLVAIYILYDVVDYSSESKGNKTIKQRNPLHISSIATTNDDYLKYCAPRVQCDPNAKYRSFNGSCNNLRTPTWGASNTSFLRLLNANYSDGFYKLREQANGSALPNVRLLNLDLFLGKENYKLDENNVLVAPFAQLIAHDMTGMLVDTLISPHGVVKSCCEKDDKNIIPQCIVSFDIPPDDPVYGKPGLRCQSKYRYMTSRNYSCPLPTTTYINLQTHFMDASEIYGSSDDIARQLRTMKDGKLNTSTNENGQTFCPYQKIPDNQPTDLKYIQFQYDSGDPGSLNQNIGITAMSILIWRFHNYIASELLTLNSFWSDEVIYQESRKIVIGSIQRIAYEEFLPIIIGKDYQELYGINAENIYDSTIDPSISQEWSSAAFRVLHTLVPVQYNFVNNNYTVESSMNITDWMSDPQLLPIDHNFDKLVKGFLETAGRLAQPSYNFYLSNYMFYTKNKSMSTGFDMMSGDIMTGRDIGLQPYNQVRNLCGLPLAENFEDLLDSMHLIDINTLKKHYNTVDDIDLMVGLLLEKQSDSALFGPTTRCLIADAFYRTKAGDRFFYDVTGQPSSFTTDQLKIIKKITLGHIICASTIIDHVQHSIFKLVDPKLFPTSKLECDDNFDIDLSAWKHTPHKTDL